MGGSQSSQVQGEEGGGATSPQGEAKEAAAAAQATPAAPAAAAAPAAPAAKAAAKAAAKDEKEQKQPLPPGEVKPTQGAAAEDEKPTKGRGKGGNKQVAKEPAGAPGTKLCIKNLPDDATSDAVKSLFEAHGSVTGIDVKTRADGKCRGFGFVSFESAEAASKAMAAMNGAKMGEKDLSVVVAVPKERAEGEEHKDEGKGKGKGKKGAEKGAIDKGKGKGKDKGKESKGKGKGKFMPPAQESHMAAQASAAPTGYNSGYNPYYQQQMAMYGNRYPSYGFGYNYNPYAYQAAAYQYQYAQAAAVAAASTPQAQAGYGSTPGGYGGSRGFGVPSSSGQRTYDGVVKSLSAKNGYGFISCDDTFSQFRRDVYVGQRDLPDGIQVGDYVRFEVTLNNKEHPRADNVVVTGRS